jgi:hypothetical protein
MTLTLIQIGILKEIAAEVFKKGTLRSPVGFSHSPSKVANARIQQGSQIGAGGGGAAGSAGNRLSPKAKVRQA